MWIFGELDGVVFGVLAFAVNCSFEVACRSIDIYEEVKVVKSWALAFAVEFQIFGYSPRNGGLGVGL